MPFQVTGKNVEAGDAFKTYISGKLVAVLEKYVGADPTGANPTGHVRLEKERGHFRTDCSIRMPTGLILEAHGEGPDAYTSADAAVERLETRVRRHKRRLKNHHNGRSSGHEKSEQAARDVVLQMDAEEPEEHNDTGHPLIVAEGERSILDLPVNMAVMHLDLTDSHFLIFRNTAHGGLNVVYRRPDGNIGWIDPTTVSSSIK